MPKAKCKYCETVIEKEDHLIILEKTKTDKDKKIHLHKKCEKEYKELMEYKQNELKWFDEIYQYILDLLDYTSEQQLPKFLITRLQDLRNGTIMKKDVGRIVKSKNGYRYEVILDTFLKKGDYIRWAFKNKTFNNEHNKINYMMAIIESDINDTYIEFNTLKQVENIKKKNNIIEEENNITNLNNKVIYTIDKNRGISKFLDEDDL
jgi:hypothetical protein